MARRAAVNPETLSFLDTDPAFVTSRSEPEVFGTRYYRHVRHPSPDGFAEVCIFIRICLLLMKTYSLFSQLGHFI